MTNAVQDASADVKTRSFAPRRRGWSRESTERAMNIVSPVALLLIWEICARMGWIDEANLFREHLLAIRRAGADWIVTYVAREALEKKWI